MGNRRPAGETVIRAILPSNRASTGNLDSPGALCPLESDVEDAEQSAEKEDVVLMPA